MRQKQTVKDFDIGDRVMVLNDERMGLVKSKSKTFVAVLFNETDNDEDTRRRLIYFDPTNLTKI